jgi:hypothetical protein
VLLSFFHFKISETIIKTGAVEDDDFGDTDVGDLLPGM